MFQLLGVDSRPTFGLEVSRRGQGQRCWACSESGKEYTFKAWAEGWWSQDHSILGPSLGTIVYWALFEGHSMLGPIFGIVIFWGLFGDHSILGSVSGIIVYWSLF